MLSQGATYALRAVIHLAGAGGGESADEIAAALGLQPSYLAKVLQALARAGILESVRGRSGGFWLAADPARLKLAQVVEGFDPERAQRFCLLRAGPCSDRTACAAHHAWKPTAEKLDEFFRATTVAQLLSNATGTAGTAFSGTRSSPECAAIP